MKKTTTKKKTPQFSQEAKMAAAALADLERVGNTYKAILARLEAAQRAHQESLKTTEVGCPVFQPDPETYWRKVVSDEAIKNLLK